MQAHRSFGLDLRCQRDPPKDHPLYQRFIRSLYCGTTEMVIEELKRYEALGCEMIFLPSQQRELIANEVLPEFR